MIIVGQILLIFPMTSFIIINIFYEIPWYGSSLLIKRTLKILMKTDFPYFRLFIFIHFPVFSYSFWRPEKFLDHWCYGPLFFPPLLVNLKAWFFGLSQGAKFNLRFCTRMNETDQTKDYLP